MIEEQAPPQALIQRSSEDQVVSGLAAGVAARLGVEAIYIRAAFVVLALVWGVGVLLYMAGWAATSGRQGTPVVTPPVERSRRVGLVLFGLGLLLAFRSVGLWPGDSVVWPAAAVVFGAAFLFDQQAVDSRTTLMRIFEPVDGRLRTRTVIGIVLLVAGLGIFGSAAVPGFGTTILAVLVTGVGLTLVFGPWIYKLAGDLGVERRERIRQEERAEMAAHLHDSVLQTLALIQRSDDSRRMVTLARAQERELRKWLYERFPEASDESFAAQLQTAADRIESDFDIPVEVVTVGDVAVDDHLRAMAAAAGEALTNAAKHAAVPRISLFAEVSDDMVEVFVTDQGKGFDPADVNGDRRGIADSMIGRMTRHGGTATVSSEIGEGTEVHLTMPRDDS